MPRKPAATPRPWIAEYDNPTSVIPGHTIKDGKYPHFPIASLWVGGGTKGKPTQRANTAFIIEAVNSHDRLVRENAEMRALLSQLVRRYVANQGTPGQFVVGMSSAHKKSEPLYALWERARIAAKQ